ncbi:MAG: SdpI family protein [Candidatus Micrarchaeota archaeon]|nr:SdpI family protein [Candidatus Micrarchaeota archaeon]
MKNAGGDGLYREILPISIILVIFAIALSAENMVITDERGELAGYWWAGSGGTVSKTIGIYSIPMLTLLVYLVLLAIPKIEVYKHNIEEFADQFWGFKVVLVFVMGVIYIATLLPNLPSGFVNWQNFNPIVIIIPSISLLFFYVGYMLNFTKRNYFIGVRTPWTLADEKIWEKTNKLAGKMFWICGVLALVSLFSPADLLLWLVLLPIVLIAIFASLYSLWEYKKAKKEHARQKEMREKKGKKR